MGIPHNIMPSPVGEKVVMPYDTVVTQKVAKTGTVVDRTLYLAGSVFHKTDKRYVYEYVPADVTCADIKTLTIGTATLSPTVSGDVGYYTTTTTGTIAVKVTPKFADATVTITYNGNAVTNGGNITVASGTNDLVITVSNGGLTKTYVVAITKQSIN